MHGDIEISEYLPVFNEQAYTSYLLNAFEQNYANEIYQFAFLAYYMLMIRFICTKVWQITRMDKLPGRVDSRLKREILEAEAPIDIEPENSRMFKAVRGILPGGNLQALISLRNGVAHANGYIQIPSADNLDERINQINIIVQHLQSVSEHAIRRHYFNFLLDARPLEEGEDTAVYLEEELVRPNHLSERDIAYCTNSNLLPLPSLKKSQHIELLHRSLTQLYPT